MAALLPKLLHLVAWCLARNALCKHGGRRNDKRRRGKCDYCGFHFTPPSMGPALQQHGR